jgi:hypothetical protein
MCRLVVNTSNAEERNESTLKVTESILGISMTSCEAQPCADIISANSLHEASQTAAYLQVDENDNLASRTRTRNSVYVRVTVERRTGNLSVFSPLVAVSIDDVGAPKSVR